MLGHEVRGKGSPHNCLDDARAAMKLVLAKIKHGVDKAFPLVEEPVSLHIHLWCYIILMVVGNLRSLLITTTVPAF